MKPVTPRGCGSTPLLTSHEPHAAAHRNPSAGWPGGQTRSLARSTGGHDPPVGGAGLPPPSVVGRPYPQCASAATSVIHSRAFSSCSTLSVRFLFHKQDHNRRTPCKSLSRNTKTRFKDR